MNKLNKEDTGVKCRCIHFDGTCHDCGNKPQDNAPQSVKSTEETIKVYVLELYPEAPYLQYVASEAMKVMQTENQFRIAELERNEKSDAKHIASLERQVKWYEKVVDKHIISTASYTSEYIDKVIAERDKLKQDKEVVDFIIDVDWMGTKEFCDKYNFPVPFCVNNNPIASARMFIDVDMKRWHVVKDFVKQKRKEQALNSKEVRKLCDHKNSVWNTMATILCRDCGKTWIDETGKEVKGG